MKTLVFTGYLLLVLGCLIPFFSGASINPYEHAKYSSEMNIPSPKPDQRCFGTCGDGADVPAFNATYNIMDAVFGLFAVAASAVFIRAHLVNGRRWTVLLVAGLALDAILIIFVVLSNF